MSDEDAIELWNERAAIREYLGGISRSRAEFLAAQDLKRILGVVPECVRLAVMEGKVKS